MSTYRNSHESQGIGLGAKFLAAGCLVALAAIGYFGFGGNSPQAPAAVAEPSNLQEVIETSKATQQVPQDERIRIYQESLEKGAQQAATWPKTEQAFLADFWKAMAAKDMAKVMMMSPGAKAEDFGPYSFFVVQGLAAIGKPEPHPTAPNVTLWPVKVNFQKFPNKTIKLALYRLPDGRLAVHGKYSIWW